LVKTEPENLARVAAALRDLNARLRVSGLSDEESTALPVQIDAILEQFDFSNWRTDAGDLDIMTSIPDRAGVHRRYMDLAGDARVLPYAGVQVRVASLNAIVASKEHANRPKDQEALPELHQLQQQMRGTMQETQLTSPKSTSPHHRGQSHPGPSLSR